MGSIIGGLFGVGSGANAASQQASNAASQQAQNAALLQQQLQGIISGNQQAFNTNYAPLIGQEGGALAGLLQNPGGAPGLTQFGPEIASLFRGIAQGGVAPQTQGFYTNEMTQGLDPRFVQSQYSGLNQAASQQLSDIVSRLGPGVNPAAAARDTQNSLLSAGTNLAGQLAGANQQTEQAGAQGLFDLGASRLQGGQGLMSLGQGLDTSRNQLLDLIQSFVGQGLSTQQGGMSALGGMAGRDINSQQFDYGLAQQDAQLAGQQQNDFFNSLVSLGTSFMPGGMFSGLFGGGGSSPVTYFSQNYDPNFAGIFGGELSPTGGG